jgi:putative ABC transport system ATP-binding protein
MDRGEFLMIRGPSGGGKTTLLNLIWIADVATSGKLSKG